MRKRSLVISLFLVFLVDVVYVSSHLCHDPFRPQERLVLVPERELVTISEVGEFRIYIENTFRSALEDLRLSVESPAFDIEITPKVLKRLVPGERAFFFVKLRLRKGFKPGDYPLRISVGARSAELRPSVERIDVVVDKEIPEPKVESLPQIKSEEEILREERQVLPEKKIEEIKLPEEDIEPREEKIEEVPQEVGEVAVRVEKIPFWKRPYFYIILILLLVGILMWRKRK